MRKLVAAEIRRGRRRVVAPAVAIVIAVAFVTLTLGATSAIKAALFRQVASRATLSDVVVSDSPSGRGSYPLPAAVAARIAAVPGVRTAEPVHSGLLQVTWSDGEDWTSLASVPAEPALRWMRSTAGRLPTGPGEVAVDDGTARDLALPLGTTLDVRTDDGRAEKATVVGIVSTNGATAVGGLRTLVAAPAVAAAWTGGRPAEVDVLAAPGVGADALRDRIDAALTAAGVRGDSESALAVRTGAQEAAARTEEFSQGVDVLGGITTAFAGIALLVATIVIGNTFTAIFAQRARSLALLRCVGATRRQVFRAVLAETAAVGIVASFAGVLAGIGLIAVGVAVLSHFVPALAGAGLGLTPTMLGVPFAVGVLVSLVAALVPARRATRVAPLAALRPLDVAAARRVSRVRVVLGVLVVLLGVGGLALGAGPLSGQAGLLVGMAGGAVTLLGMLLMGPVVVPVLVRLLGRTTGRWVPGRVAVTNAVRNPVRAASTSVALFVGVSLVTMMGVAAGSASAATETVLQKDFPLDLAVAAPRGGTLPASAVTGLGALPGTQAAVAVPGATVRVDAAHQLDVVGADPAAFAAVWRDTDPAHGLRDGVALVPWEGLEQLGAKGGATVRLPGLPALRVVRAEVPAAVVTTGDLARLRAGGATGGTGVRAVLLRARPDVVPSAYRTSVRQQVTGVPGTRTEGSITQRAEVDDAVSVVLRIVIGLLGAAVLIAVVGIANTLSLSVLERSRELAVQRALGMTRRQLRTSLTVEALLLAVVGAVLGVVLGTGYGWAGARALVGSVSASVPLVVPWGLVGAMTAVALAAGALASVLPGRRAARMAPVAALASE